MEGNQIRLLNHPARQEQPSKKRGSSATTGTNITADEDLAPPVKKLKTDTSGGLSGGSTTPEAATAAAQAAAEKLAALMKDMGLSSTSDVGGERALPLCSIFSLTHTHILSLYI